MAAKISSETREAMRLIREGMKAQPAAIKAGIHPTTIYRSALYKEWLKEKSSVK